MIDFNEFKLNLFCINGTYHPWNDKFDMGNGEWYANSWNEYRYKMRAYLGETRFCQEWHRYPTDLALPEYGKINFIEDKGRLEYAGLQSCDNYMHIESTSNIYTAIPKFIYIFDIQDSTADTKIQIELSDYGVELAAKAGGNLGNVYYYDIETGGWESAKTNDGVEELQQNMSYYITCKPNMYHNGKLYLGLFTERYYFVDIIGNYKLQDVINVKPISNIKVNSHRITYTVNVSASPAVLIVYAKNNSVTKTSIDTNKFVDTADNLVTYKETYSTTGVKTIDIWCTDENEELVVKNALNCTLGNRELIW